VAAGKKSARTSANSLRQAQGLSLPKAVESWPTLQDILFGSQRSNKLLSLITKRSPRPDPNSFEPDNFYCRATLKRDILMSLFTDFISAPNFECIAAIKKK
jgi:hypothetical protein